MILNRAFTNRMRSQNRVIAAAVLVIGIVGLFASSGCVRRNLRGWYEDSPDGKTYLVVEDANETACKQIAIDGVLWPHAVHERGLIQPGDHVIRCAGEIRFTVPKGTIYHFDYWGP